VGQHQQTTRHLENHAQRQQVKAGQESVCIQVAVKKFWNVNGRNCKRTFDKKNCFFGWFFFANRRNCELGIILTVFLSMQQIQGVKNTKCTIKTVFY